MRKVSKLCGISIQKRARVDGKKQKKVVCKCLFRQAERERLLCVQGRFRKLRGGKGKSRGESLVGV